MWGDKTLIISNYLHLAFYTSLAFIGYINEFSLLYVVMLIVLLGLYIYQKKLLNNKQYLDAFKFNHWIGMMAAMGFIVEIFLV